MSLDVLSRLFVCDSMCWQMLCVCVCTGGKKLLLFKGTESVSAPGQYVCVCMCHRDLRLGNQFDHKGNMKRNEFLPVFCGWRIKQTQNKPNGDTVPPID